MIPQPARTAKLLVVRYRLLDTDLVDRMKGTYVATVLSHTHHNRHCHLGRCPVDTIEKAPVSGTELYLQLCDLFRAVQPAAEPLRVTGVRVPLLIVARFRLSLECCRLTCRHLTGSAQQVLGQFDCADDVLRIPIGPD
jgi:hypothetical protein